MDEKPRSVYTVNTVNKYSVKGLKRIDLPELVRHRWINIREQRGIMARFPGKSQFDEKNFFPICESKFYLPQGGTRCGGQVPIYSFFW